MMRKFTAVCAALATAASGLLIASTSPASAASTYYACVKKGDGQTTMVKKKTKCKKGWKKVSWSKNGPTGPAGPTGANGPAGPALSVKDGAGGVVGLFMGTWSGLVPGFTVLADGGLWNYGSDGALMGDSSPAFTDPTCATPGIFVRSYPPNPAETARTVARFVPNSLGRLVYRSSNVAAAARAWKVSGQNSAAVLGGNIFVLDSAGNCVYESTVDADDVAAAATLVGLTEVPPPPNHPAPLTVG